MAVKKAGGSTKNGRGSRTKRLGVKLFGLQKAKGGSIIIRQKGSKFLSGENTTLGRDFTITANVHGTVKFTNLGGKKVVNVVVG